MVARSQPWDQRAAWAVVTIVCLASAWLRFRFLADFETPVGIDGYYYPIQVRSLSESGNLYYPSAPLVPWLMWLASAFTDPITGCKLVAALGTATIGLPVLGVCRRLELAPWPSAAAAVMATTSGSSLYLSVEFAKSGVGLTVAMFALWAVLAGQGRPAAHKSARESLKSWALPLIAVLAAVLAHKLATAVLVILAAPMVVAKARRSRRWLIGSIAAVVALAVVGLLMPERFLSPAALSPLKTMWTWKPTLTAAIYDPGGQPLSFGGDVMLAAAAAVAALIASWRLQFRTSPVIVGAAIFALIIALPFVNVADTNGLGPRLRLLAFIPGALCTAAALDAASRRLTWLGPAVFLGIVAGLVFARPRAPGDGVVVPHPQMLRALALMPDSLIGPQTVVIIPDRQLVFASVWMHRVESRRRPEGTEPQRRVRLLPAWATTPELVSAIRSATAQPAPGVPAPVALDPGQPLTLTAVREPTWEWLLTQVPPAQRDRLRRWPTP
ncbi:MAG: hypothetical protein KJO07_01125 [Deltaproteobacteria bacterium]|nr:hypothetical protein [Deltaproteobacteria bacterium]